MWPFEMKGTKRKQKVKQLNAALGYRAIPSALESQHSNRKAFNLGQNAALRLLGGFIHCCSKVRHVGHGVRPVEQISVPAPYEGAACALKNRMALVLALALLANYTNPVGPRYPRPSSRASLCAAIRSCATLRTAALILSTCQNRRTSFSSPPSGTTNQRWWV